METLDPATSTVEEFLERVGRLNARYRAGDMRVGVPEALRESDRTLEDLVQDLFPASHAVLEAASSSLFFSRRVRQLPTRMATVWWMIRSTFSALRSTAPTPTSSIR